MYKILVADDEELEREALRYFIENSGLEIERIIECGSGDEAMKQILLVKPEIILLDINMPGLNGLEVLEKLQRMEYRKRVIFSTAYDYFEYAVQALRLGAMDFMVKPVKKEQIISVITHAIDELDEEFSEECDRAALKEMLDVMGGKIVRNLVTGNLLEEDLYYLEILGIPYEVAGNVYCASLMEEISTEKQRQIGKLLKEEFHYLDMMVVLAWKNRMLTLVVFLNGKKQVHQIAMIEKVIASVLKQTRLPFILGQGEMFEDLSQIEQSFGKARESLGDVIRQAEEKTGMRGISEDVEQICQFLKENYSHKLTLEEIAATAGYSKYYINRLFKQYKGTTVMDYLIRIRIQEAKKLLRTDNYSVKQISMMVGYSEPNYFTLTFKKLEGVSPLKYRYQKGTATPVCPEKDESG